VRTEKVVYLWALWQVPSAVRVDEPPWSLCSILGATMVGLYMESVRCLGNRGPKAGRIVPFQPIVLVPLPCFGPDFRPAHHRGVQIPKWSHHGR
jgi:hypothetical protein